MTRDEALARARMVCGDDAPFQLVDLVRAALGKAYADGVDSATEEVGQLHVQRARLADEVDRLQAAVAPEWAAKSAPIRPEKETGDE